VTPTGTDADGHANLPLPRPHPRSRPHPRRQAAPSSTSSSSQTFGLPALSLNDAGAYAFSNSFDYSQAPLPTIPMVQQPVVSTGVVVQDPNDPI